MLCVRAFVEASVGEVWGVYALCAPAASLVGGGTDTTTEELVGEGVGEWVGEWVEEWVGECVGWFRWAGVGWDVLWVSMCVVGRDNRVVR